MMDSTDLDDDTFEDRAYPNAPSEVRTWLKINRDLVRAFLRSEYGRSEAGPQRKSSYSGNVDTTVVDNLDANRLKRKIKD